MDVSQLMQVVHEAREDDDPIEKALLNRIASLKRKLALAEKVLAEIREIGPAKFDRIYMMLGGKDPDASLKVGPHGPGCECDPSELDEDDPACRKH